MTDDAVSYPADAGASTYLLTVRGQTVPTTMEDTRDVHNSTAGAPPSVAAARSLGDLSHNAYVGCSDDLKGELLFIDMWNSPTGLGEFFANPHVAAAAGQLFSARDAVVWARAEGFGEFHLNLPAGRSLGGVGLLRVTVTSLAQAAQAFTAYAAATINRSRSLGLVGHSIWTRVPDPGDPPTTEVLGVDLWSDAADMNRYYQLGLGFEHFGPVFAAPPDTSTWQSAPGDWVEW